MFLYPVSCPLLLTKISQGGLAVINFALYCFHLNYNPYYMPHFLFLMRGIQYTNPQSETVQITVLLGKVCYLINRMCFCQTQTFVQHTSYMNVCVRLFRRGAKRPQRLLYMYMIVFFLINLIKYVLPFKKMSLEGNLAKMYLLFGSFFVCFLLYEQKIYLS